VLLRAGKGPEARAAAVAAQETFPQSAPVAAVLGRTYEVGGDFATARNWYGQAATIRPKRSDHRASVGYILARTGDWKGAESVLRLAERLNAHDIEAKLHLGWVLNHQGKFAEALQEYEAILKVNKDHLRALWCAGDLLVLLGKQKDADRVLTHLLTLKPDHDEALRLKAQLSYKMGKADEAMKLLDQALALNAKNPHALFLKGFILDDQDDSEGAEKSYKAAAEADPTYSWPHLYLGELYDEVLDKPVDALKCYRKYLELGGPDPDGLVKDAVDALAKETGQ
jgi:tetratricopeptide (TPR) repeat protein